MKACFIKDENLVHFVDKLIGSTKVIAPIAKKTKFVFDEIKSSGDLRLDYDVTILPPKKAFFPPTQELVRFSADKVESAINPTPQILLGVHFYDVKAIDMLDQLFRADHADYNYLANREKTTIIASSIQRVSERAFFATVGSEVKPVGHDAFLTKIQGGYVYETLTEKGDALIKFGQFVDATKEQIAEAKKVNDDALTKCPEKLSQSSEEIAEKVRNSFSSKIWEELSEDCFSCGTCNIVCPTCYCFDVQDKWGLDQISGTRCRSWDACLTEDFAKVSLGGGGHEENFREERAERYRHRVMRKATYLNNNLGGPACVGCGRCSAGCVPDIADPVNIINRIMEG